MASFNKCVLVVVILTLVPLLVKTNNSVVVVNVNAPLMPLTVVVVVHSVPALVRAQDASIYSKTKLVWMIVATAMHLYAVLMVLWILILVYARVELVTVALDAMSAHSTVTPIKSKTCVMDAYVSKALDGQAMTVTYAPPRFVMATMVLLMHNVTLANVTVHGLVPVVKPADSIVTITVMLSLLVTDATVTTIGRVPTVKPVASIVKMAAPSLLELVLHVVVPIPIPSGAALNAMTVMHPVKMEALKLLMVLVAALALVDGLVKTVPLAT